MLTKHPLTNKEFNTIFQRFNDEVYAGNYSKMAYQDWKLFTRSIAENKDFYLVFLSKSQTVQVFINRAFVDMIYTENDGSFGTFLFNNVYTIIDNTTNNKENNVMNFNFDFGPVNPSLVRMSMYGLAVKNKAGTWVSYNSNSDEIVDVDVLNFDGAKFLYRMPVAIKDITVGDVVIHNSAPMFVVSVPQDGKTLTVVDTINGERKDIMLPRSPFGFNFATKVVNFLGNMMTGANADNPFGNMWMLMAMSGEGEDMKDILPFLMMNNATVGMDNNMLMFMALSNTKDGSKDMLPWLLMSQSMNAAPAHVCKCGSCGENPTQG